MKICSKCKIHLDEGCFNKCSSSKDGLLWKCRKCVKHESSLYYEKNKEKIKKATSAWRKNNKEKSSVAAKKYRLERKEFYLQSFRNWREKNKELHLKKVVAWQKNNIEKVKENSCKWRRNNKHIIRLLSAERRLICKTATPKWANKFFIKEIYHLAQLRSDKTGFMWHVDHIIPLKGKGVCGLHVETNMQIIPWIENIRKSNKVL